MFILLASPPSMKSNAARRDSPLELMAASASDAAPPFCCLKYVQPGKQNRAIFAASIATLKHDLQAKSGNLESRWRTSPCATHAATATCVRPMLRFFFALGVALPQQLHRKSPVPVEEDELEEEEEEFFS